MTLWMVQSVTGVDFLLSGGCSGLFGYHKVLSFVFLLKLLPARFASDLWTENFVSPNRAERIDILLTDG